MKTAIHLTFLALSFNASAQWAKPTSFPHSRSLLYVNFAEAGTAVGYDRESEGNGIILKTTNGVIMEL